MMLAEKRSEVMMTIAEMEEIAGTDLTADKRPEGGVR
jgi:hypothetical protein